MASGGEHVARHDPCDREADEHVGVLQRFGQRAHREPLRKALLVAVEIVAIGVNHALLIAHHDVVTRHAQAHVVLRGGDRGGPGAREYDLNLGDVFLCDFERVEQSRARDDGRAVLVVVEHGDRQRLPQLFLDVEAVGRADVFEVDAAHRRLEQLAEADYVLGILGAHLQVEHVDVGEGLEQNPFAFHHRLARQRADVAQAEHRRAVRDHRHEVAAGRVLVGILRPLGDLEARLRHPRRVRQGEVALVLERLGGGDLDLPRPALTVIVESLLPAAWHRRHKSFFRKGLC